MTARMQQRRDTAANWTSTNPTLAAGEMGLETDTYKFKVGNGSTAWTALPYAVDIPAQTGQSGKYLTTDGTASSWGTVAGYSAPTLGSTSIASGATVTTIAGLTLYNPTITASDATSLSNLANFSFANNDGSNFFFFNYTPPWAYLITGTFASPQAVTVSGVTGVNAAAANGTQQMYYDAGTGAYYFKNINFTGTPYTSLTTWLPGIVITVGSTNTVSSTEIGYLDGVTDFVQTQLQTKAPINDPTFTGIVTIPTGALINRPKISTLYELKTATWTFSSGGEGILYGMNSSGAAQFNIPTDASFNAAIGSEYNAIWIGGTQPTIGATSPGTTTVLSTGAVTATPKLRAINSMAKAVKLAANLWIVTGDIA